MGEMLSGAGRSYHIVCDPMIVLDELRDAWKSEPPDHRLALTVIIALGIGLRAMYLAQPMRYDEAVTYMYFVRLPWPDALSTYTYPNNHLFHTFLAKLVVSAFGNEPWALRIPALLAGIAIIPAAYAMARQLYGARAALVATALVSTSGVLIMFSTNARGYTLMTLAFLLLVLVAVRLLRAPSKDLWTQLVVIAALGLWTLPSMLYPFGAVMLWLALSFLVEGKRAELRRLMSAGVVTVGLTALLYWPVASKEGLAAITRNRFVAPSPWFDFLHELPGTIGNALQSWSLGLPPLVSLAFALIAIVALRRHAALSTSRIGLPLAAFTWSAWLLVVNHRAPFGRTWIWALPIVASLAGAGVVFLLERSTRLRGIAERRIPLVAGTIALVTAASVVTSFAVLLTRDTGTYREAAEAAAAVKSVVGPQDRVLAIIPTNGPLDYYLHKEGVPREVMSRPEQNAARVFAVVDQGEGQTLDQVVRYSVVRDTNVWAPPATLATFQQSAVIVFQRKRVPTR